MSMDVSGFGELYAALARLGANVDKVVNQALKAGAQPIADAMSENVNVSARHEVHVRDDIKIGRPRQDADGVRYITIGPSARTAWRAKFLEFGTSKMPAYPFMEPAMHEQQRAAFDAMRQVIKGALK
ncbi:MAG: HK97 gp10 family phage protein [Alicyclobacillus sp.]|nr:HK97 gp10 family phage protein [Alicyclobacillus sp.]